LIRVCVLAHSLLFCLQTLVGFLVHGVHPVRIDLAGRVERIFRCQVGSHRVESVVGVKWRQFCSGSYRIVVHELYHGQQRDPVVLLVIDIRAKVYLNGLVEAFGLAIRLGVEDRGHPRADAQKREELLTGLRS